LQSIQYQQNQEATQLAQARTDLSAKKQALDALQAKLARGEINRSVVAAAEAEYDRASGEIARLEAQAAALAGQARQQTEKVDTLTSAVKLDSFLSNVGPSVLSGTFSRADLDTFINVVNTKSAAQLVTPANKFIADIKFVLNTGAKIRAAVPNILNSPIVDSFVIPVAAQFLGGAIQAKAEEKITANPSQDRLNTTWVSYVRTDQNGGYTLNLALKDAIKGSTAGLQDELTTVEYQGVLTFIDNYFRDHSNKITEAVSLSLKVGDPTVLQDSMRKLLMTLKPVASDVIGQMPDAWVSWFVEMIQEIPRVDAADMQEFKDEMASIAPMLASIGLSAEAPVSTSGNTAYRRARSEVGGVGLNQLVVDGQALDQSYALDMPLRVDLKGSLNTAGRTTDVVGSVTYNINGTVIGAVQSFGNMVDRHFESSVLVSQSIGNFFIEGQAGFIGVQEGLLSGWEGQRYQVTLGYDTAYVSPFIQLEYRPLSNGFSTLDATGVYMGVESDVLKVQLADAVFTSTVLAKVGYESATETLFTGHSLRANQCGAAFVEWNGGLKLSSGFEVKSALTLGSKDKTVKLNIAFEQ
jgi:hypothetical protein